MRFCSGVLLAPPPCSPVDRNTLPRCVDLCAGCVERAAVVDHDIRLCCPAFLRRLGGDAHPRFRFAHAARFDQAAQLLLRGAGHHPDCIADLFPASFQEFDGIDHGDLCVHHLGKEPTDDIPTMTRTARTVLRQRFLQADMGISGVNFGVANEGAIVIVENEGNARLTTTAPRIHVAIMGIERICESLDDLGVLLQVLARSATGQRLSVYTSIISGPRRPHEPDGPDEFHLVLLDNRRSEIIGGPYAEALMCIRCGACLNACPVYQSIGGHAYGGVYSGPIGAILTPLLQPDLPDAHKLPHASSLCGACEWVCPVRIAIPDLLLRLRADAVKNGKFEVYEPLAMFGWRQVMTNPAFYRLGGKMASLGTRLLGRNGPVRWLPPPLDGWTKQRDFPPFAPKTFTELWEERKKQE